MKFSSRQSGTDLELSVRANDQPVLSGTIPNAPPRLATGHLAITYMGGSVTNSYLDHVLIKQEDEEGDEPWDTEVIEVTNRSGMECGKKQLEQP